ncbi:choice-of-anchor D domain-containing protein [Tahibacter sp. UC22_41]|uniref:choice-of-anchor D domain-containing protein n=1 Tax=Tahibacter sp. UC22_41 TaxID=3350178 RepID=UPI0036DC65BA
MRCATRLLLGMLSLGAAASASADLLPSPGQVDFGWQAVNTTSEPKATTLRNTGNQPLTVVAVAPASGVYARTGGSCGETPFTIAAQASCTIEHTFTPTAVTQFYQTLTINLAGGTSVNFGLYGQAEVGHLEIAPSALSFFPVPAGSVGNELTAQLTNDRPVTLRIWQMTSTAGSGFVRTGGNCPEPPMEFGAYMGCMLKYTFMPTRVGESELNLIFLGSSGTFLLRLSGEGLPEIPLFQNGFEVPAPAPNP